MTIEQLKTANLKQKQGVVEITIHHYEYAKNGKHTIDLENKLMLASILQKTLDMEFNKQISDINLLNQIYSVLNYVIGWYQPESIKTSYSFEQVGFNKEQSTQVIYVEQSVIKDNKSPVSSGAVYAWVTEFKKDVNSRGIIREW